MPFGQTAPKELIPLSGRCHYGTSGIIRQGKMVPFSNLPSTTYNKLILSPAFRNIQRREAILATSAFIRTRPH